MNKTLIILLLINFSIASYADDTMPTSSTLKGVHIVPMADQALPMQMKEEILITQAEEKQKGYRETDAKNVQYLLNIHQSMSVAVKKYENDEKYDTHLKKSYKNIKLAFLFNGIPDVEQNEMIGYAPIGSFSEKGWNGIRGFFIKPSMGNCAYSHMRIVGVQLTKETTEYLVNKKPSNKIIEGNRHSGFLYTINWYTEEYMNTLECANKLFKPEIMTKMIVLANRIDKKMDGWFNPG